MRSPALLTEGSAPSLPAVSDGAIELVVSQAEARRPATTTADVANARFFTLYLIRGDLMIIYYRARNRARNQTKVAGMRRASGLALFPGTSRHS